ncbi:MAG: rhomboid family intramembrane serine protease [Pseudomonadota bacterium]
MVNVNEDGPERTRAPRQRIFLIPSTVVWLLGVLWAVFAVEVVTDVFGSSALKILVFDFFFFVPGELTGTQRWSGVSPAISLVTHIFAHADLLHIGSNSIWLMICGTPVYRRLRGEGIVPMGGVSFLAHKRPAAFAPAVFLTLFVLGGIAGVLVLTAMQWNSNIAVIGASGGVSALLGALMRFGFRRPRYFAPVLQPLTPLNDRIVIVFTVVFTFLNAAGGMLGLEPKGVEVAWEAHVGGYLFGLLTFPLFDRVAGNTFRAPG